VGDKATSAVLKTFRRRRSLFPLTLKFFVTLHEVRTNIFFPMNVSGCLDLCFNVPLDGLCRWCSRLANASEAALASAPLMFRPLAVADHSGFDFLLVF